MSKTGNISGRVMEHTGHGAQQSARQIIERYCAHLDANVVMSRRTTNMGIKQNRCLEAHRCEKKDCKNR